jgi:hypothetical protein
LQNYVDAANVPAELQDKRYQTAQRNVKQWGSKAVLIRNYTTHAVHDIKEQVSFVYVDARVSETGCQPGSGRRCWHAVVHRAP